MKVFRNFRFAMFMSIGAASVSARTLNVGPGKAFTMPSAAARAAASGDTILIDPVRYSGDEAVWRASNLVIRSPLKHAWITAPATLSNLKAIWVIQGNNVRIENIRLSGAAVPDRNGAGIRAEGSGLVIRGCYIHDNQAGIITNNVATLDLVVEYSHVARNGIGNGYTHNIYAGNIRSFILRYSQVHHARGGQNVKSRAATTHILYNRIVDSTDGTSNYEIDLPNGGNAIVLGNTIQQSPLTTNSIILHYGQEGLKYVSNGLMIVNNTFDNRRSSGYFIRFPAGFSPVRVMNNLFIGAGTTITGGGAETASNISTTSSTSSFRVLSYSGFDYHLAAGSVTIDRGTNPGTFAGQSLTPTWQWSASAGGERRPVNGALDVGAFEY